TSWLDVDVAYEAAICDHVRRWFGDAEFLTDFSARLKPWQEASTILSLSQTLAKLTAPGIPDMYQGAEGLALSLVDPDNRRPVDFESLSRALDAASFNKQEMIARILALRAKHLQLFLTGLYLPLA